MSHIFNQESNHFTSSYWAIEVSSHQLSTTIRAFTFVFIIFVVTSTLLFVCLMQKHQSKITKWNYSCSAYFMFSISLNKWGAKWSWQPLRSCVEKKRRHGELFSWNACANCISWYILLIFCDCVCGVNVMTCRRTNASINTDIRALVRDIFHLK